MVTADTLGIINLRALCIIVSNISLQISASLAISQEGRRALNLCSMGKHLSDWPSRGTCCSDWQAMYVCHILRTMTDDQAICQCSWQIRNVSNLTGHKDTQPEWGHLTYSVEPVGSACFFSSEIFDRDACHKKRYVPLLLLYCLFLMHRYFYILMSHPGSLP